MSEKKRYYWLKLPNTYFSQLEQKKMRKQEHGKDMQIIYLRMMLYSLGRNGCIYYQNVYDTIEEELAEEFDEDVELIKETVKYLLDNNMISVEDSNISIPEVDRITGSECYSAERMRRMREKKKASQCDSGVTVSDDSVTGCDEENRDEILFNLGGYLNHSLYFYNLTNKKKDIPIELLNLINKYFGSFSLFKEEFIDMAMEVKGSGYTFLVMDKNNKLRIINTSNQDTPYYYGFTPIMTIDVWEHAYYLKYTYLRKKYLENVFDIIDFDKVYKLYLDNIV